MTVKSCLITGTSAGFGATIAVTIGWITNMPAQLNVNRIELMPANHGGRALRPPECGVCRPVSSAVC